MCVKVCYDSYYEAKKNLKILNKWADCRNKTRLKKIYKCKECGAYHLTRSTEVDSELGKTLFFRTHKYLEKDLEVKYKLKESEV
jgi:hypothetical protein